MTNDVRVLVWLSIWTVLYKLLVRKGLSPWRSHVWVSFLHALLVSTLTLPHAVSISCFADPETLLFSPSPVPWVLDAALGYYTFDTIRSVDLLLKLSARTPRFSRTFPLTGCTSSSSSMAESSPFLVPTTFPFSMSLSISLSTVLMTDLYRLAAFALLSEELSTVFLRLVQLLPSRHPTQLGATLLFSVFFVVMRVVVGMVLVSRSFEVMNHFTWATAGERFVHIYLVGGLVVSRIVHFLWLGAMVVLAI